MQFSDFLTIEVVVPGVAGAPPGAGTTQPFGKQDYLQSYIGGKTVFVQRVEAYNDQVCTISPITICQRVVNVVDFLNISVVFNVAGKDRFKDVPLSRLNNMRQDTTPNFAPTSLEPFDWWHTYEVNWPQCYLRFLAAPTTAVPFSVLFGIYFSYQSYPNEEEQVNTVR